jgi:hypothetical protein
VLPPDPEESPETGDRRPGSGKTKDAAVRWAEQTTYQLSTRGLFPCKEHGHRKGIGQK